jgi:hypothetical protein
MAEDDFSADGNATLTTGEAVLLQRIGRKFTAALLPRLLAIIFERLKTAAPGTEVILDPAAVREALQTIFPGKRKRENPLLTSYAYAAKHWPQLIAALAAKNIHTMKDLRRAANARQGKKINTFNKDIRTILGKGYLFRGDTLLISAKAIAAAAGMDPAILYAPQIAARARGTTGPIIPRRYTTTAGHGKRGRPTKALKDFPYLRDKNPGLLAALAAKGIRTGVDACRAIERQTGAKIQNSNVLYDIFGKGNLIDLRTGTLRKAAVTLCAATGYDPRLLLSESAADSEPPSHADRILSSASTVAASLVARNITTMDDLLSRVPGHFGDREGYRAKFRPLINGRKPYHPQTGLFLPEAGLLAFILEEKPEQLYSTFAAEMRETAIFFRQQKTFAPLVQRHTSTLSRDRARITSPELFRRVLARALTMDRQESHELASMEDYPRLFEGTALPVEDGNLTHAAALLMRKLKIPSREVTQGIPALRPLLLFTDLARQSFPNLAAQMCAQDVYTLPALRQRAQQSGTTLTPVFERSLWEGLNAASDKLLKNPAAQPVREALAHLFDLPESYLFAGRSMPPPQRNRIEGPAASAVHVQTLG